jgi:hypothetical protein
MSTGTQRLIGTLCLLWGLGYCGSTAAFKLITEEEAKYPDDPVDDRLRDPFPGPVINILGCPKEVFALPMDLTLELKAFGGATIDMDSLRVTYMKQPRVNLTSRIRAANAIKAAGNNKVVISIEDAEIPVGQHTLQVWAKDSRNKDSKTLFVVDVQTRQDKPVWSWDSKTLRHSFFAAFTRRCG